MEDRLKEKILTEQKRRLNEIATEIKDIALSLYEVEYEDRQYARDFLDNEEYSDESCRDELAGERITNSGMFKAEIMECASYEIKRGIEAIDGILENIDWSEEEEEKKTE